MTKLFCVNDKLNEASVWPPSRLGKTAYLPFPSAGCHCLLARLLLLHFPKPQPCIYLYFRIIYLSLPMQSRQQRRKSTRLAAKKSALTPASSAPVEDSQEAPAPAPSPTASQAYPRTKSPQTRTRTQAQQQQQPSTPSLSDVLKQLVEVSPEAVEPVCFIVSCISSPLLTFVLSR